MAILASGIDHNLDRLYEQFEDEFGFGPCGAYAALRREQGWGDVAACIARSGHTEFPHYIIVQDGDIIDLANPLGEPLTYHDIEILENNEMPDLCWTGEAINWLRERL